MNYCDSFRTPQGAPERQKNSSSKTIFVAGDHDFAIERICSTLSGTPFKVLESFSDCLDARDAICDSDADMFVFSFKSGNGLALFKTLRKLRNPQPVLLLVDASEGDLILEAIRFGVNGVASTDTPSDLLLQCVTEVAYEGTWIDTSLMRRPFRTDESASLADISNDTRPPRQKKDLTLRQREVLSLVRSGLGYGEIAAELGISNKTVHMHVTDICRRLCLMSPSELISCRYPIRSFLDRSDSPIIRTHRSSRPAR